MNFSQRACNAAFGVFVVAAVIGAAFAIAHFSAPTSKQFKYEVEIIDGCEYLRFYSANSHEAITHKGNCKNH